MEETELIRAVKEGDMRAFEALFEIYKSSAIKTAYLLTRNQFTSEDIVQEAFVTCYLSLNSLKRPEYFKTWFYKILTHIAWRHMKKEKRLVPTESINEVIESNQDSHLTSGIEYCQSQSELYNEILKLNYKLRTTIILYYYNELSVREIAKVMGCLEGTVKSRLHTARKQLKASLIKEYGVQMEACGI